MLTSTFDHEIVGIRTGNARFVIDTTVDFPHETPMEDLVAGVIESPGLVHRWFLVTRMAVGHAVTAACGPYGLGGVPASELGGGWLRTQEP